MNNTKHVLIIFLLIVCFSCKEKEKKQIKELVKDEKIQINQNKKWFYLECVR